MPMQTKPMSALNANSKELLSLVHTMSPLYGIDRITKNHYKADVKKDSITLAPATEAEQPKPAEPEKAQ